MTVDPDDLADALPRWERHSLSETTIYRRHSRREDKKDVLVLKAHSYFGGQQMVEVTVFDTFGDAATIYHELAGYERADRVVAEVIDGETPLSWLVEGWRYGT